MKFIENELYHIYNRGNNRQPIFFDSDTYLYFLKKVRQYVLPHCDVICYCLMSNHFHFLIASDKQTVQTKRVGVHEKNVLSEGFCILLSTYTQGINKQNETVGSLFQQNTKSKILAGYTDALMAFHYIHQNPLKAELCSRMKDWDYSSFKDYIGQRNGTLCNKDLVTSLLDLNLKTIYNESYQTIIDETTLLNIF